VPAGGTLLIAECKKASPSRGLIVESYDPVFLAREYERGGAGMVSVLTEPHRFLGSDAHLASVRSAIGLPVLRKDFIVEEYQVLESWAIGADAILLIVAALDSSRLLQLAQAACGLGLSVLVETHTEKEIETALDLVARLSRDSSSIAIGVNARDLTSFSVDHKRAASRASLLKESPFSVAESGLTRPEEAAALKASGYRGFLVGEALASSANPAEKVRDFVSAISGLANNNKASQGGSEV
jgi:indole-3-glycerol phosphate synthase